MIAFVVTVCAVIVADAPLPRGAIARAQLFNGASVAFTPDGGYIVGRYYDGGCIIFPATREKIANEDLRKEFEGDCALSQDAKWLAVKDGDQSPVEVLQLPEIKRIASFKASGEPVAISDDGTKVLLQTRDGLTEVFCQTGETARTEKCEKRRVEAIRWLSNDTVIYKVGTSSSDQSEVWPVLKAFGRAESIVLPSGKDAERAERAAVSRNQRVLAVRYSNRDRYRDHRYRGNVVLYDLKTGSAFKYLPRDMPGSDYCVSFSSASDLMAVGGGFMPREPDPTGHQGAFRIYDSRTGSLKAGLTFGEEPIVSVRFSADDSKFVTGSAKGEVIVWSTAKFLGE